MAQAAQGGGAVTVPGGVQVWMWQGGGGLMVGLGDLRGLFQTG